MTFNQGIDMSSRRLFWRIVEKIEASINKGNYPEGSRLPPERELAEVFGVSRPTIREAIIALEVRGKVEVKTGSGQINLAGYDRPCTLLLWCRKIQYDIGTMYNI